MWLENRWLLSLVWKKLIPYLNRPNKSQLRFFSSRLDSLKLSFKKKKNSISNYLIMYWLSHDSTPSFLDFRNVSLKPRQWNSWRILIQLSVILYQFKDMRNSMDISETKKTFTPCTLWPLILWNDYNFLCQECQCKWLGGSPLSSTN